MCASPGGWKQRCSATNTYPKLDLRKDVERFVSEGWGLYTERNKHSVALSSTVVERQRINVDGASDIEKLGFPISCFPGILD